MHMLNESVNTKPALAAITAPWEHLKSQMRIWERTEDDRGQIQKTKLFLYPMGNNRLNILSDKTSIKRYFNLTWKDHLFRGT